MAATVDRIAGGRLEFGIGAGGSAVAGPNPAVREHAAYGYPLVSPGRAVRDLGEALDVIKRMWAADEPFDYDGPSLTLRGAICAPRPVQRPHPPIMIGGRGDKMLRLVAEHANLWTYPGGMDDAFAERDAKLVALCTEIGRDPAEITRSVQLLVRAEEPQVIATTRATIARAIEAGVTHIVLAAVLGGRPLQWLADEIVVPFV
jgi:alkanesulfonate monooxygenase SsuD/methylene tetrahydromethanopterin reductase-like flavin-dependent oxidoreductase (luciferase family)